jgi:choline kinase
MNSLYMARHRLGSTFLLVESDLVYERRAITVCMESKYENVVVLSGRTGAGDEVHAITRGRRLVTLSKDRGAFGAEPTGEYIGISKISPSLYGAMCQHAVRHASSCPSMEYDIDCLASLAGRYPINYELIPDLLWSEIDNPSQLRRARTLIYPKLAAHRHAGPGHSEMLHVT